MLPSPFQYKRPGSVQDALKMLSSSEDAKVLAGGHSLIPAMKLRLAQPSALVDLGRIAGLNYIREKDGLLAIGAMTTHHEIEMSELILDKCPLMAYVASKIGDVQVRNRGTLGGSLVHADPAADWPAAVLALDAEFEIAGPNVRRTVKGESFFVEMMQSAVLPNEILCEIRVPITPKSVAYVKFAQKASGFAIAGVAAVVRPDSNSVAVGITGIAPKAYRAHAVESALNGKTITPELLLEASKLAIDEIEPLGDIHASAVFRAHLAQVNCRRAIELAMSR
jgi:carbon-monoxide dehydrogenase medium subunit